MMYLMQVMAILTISLEQLEFVTQMPSKMATSLASAPIEALKCEEVKCVQATSII